MRDPARIDRMLATMGELWRKNRDLRLAQIVVNAAGPGEPTPRIFYTEDDVLERHLLEALAADA